MAKVIDRELLGEAVHTAFRKAADGPVASIIWHTISAMPPTMWALFLDKLYDRASVIGFVKPAFLIAADNFSTGKHLPIILHSALRLLSDAQYKDISEFIISCMPEESNE